MCSLTMQWRHGAISGYGFWAPTEQRSLENSMRRSCGTSRRVARASMPISPPYLQTSRRFSSVSWRRVLLEMAKRPLDIATYEMVRRTFRCQHSGDQASGVDHPDVGTAGLYRAVTHRPVELVCLASHCARGAAFSGGQQPIGGHDDGRVAEPGPRTQCQPRPGVR